MFRRVCDGKPTIIGKFPFTKTIRKSSKIRRKQKNRDKLPILIFLHIVNVNADTVQSTLVIYLSEY